MKNVQTYCFLVGFLLLMACHGASQKLGKEIITVKEDTWRSATVFTHVIWNDILFYGGGSGSDGGDPRHEMEIGAYILMKPDSGYQYDHNPIVTREQFGLNEPGKGITPLSIFERGDSLFMFCTSRPDDDLQPHIVLISAAKEDPFTWGKYRTIIDEAFSGQENNHGASILIDPDHPENILVYFAALSSGTPYRILLATVPVADISNLNSYRLLKNYENAVLKRDGVKTNYPFVSYDPDSEEYNLWYSGQTIGDESTRSCYRTTSNNKFHFEPANSVFHPPSLDSTRNDNVYATGPKVYKDYLYYSGRNERSGSYRGIFCTPLE